jgi:hypothetical protein
VTVRTEDLIEALAAETPATPGGFVRRRIGLAALGGALAALAVLMMWLGPRPDLALAMGGVSFWIKLGYAATLAAAGGVLADRLARPGAGPGWRWLLAAAPVMILAVIATMASAGETPGQMHQAMMGHSSRLCPWRILALASPVFVAALWAFRRLAPTQLAQAGFAAGLLAGGVGASVYGLACDETAPLFVLVWYTAGIAACAGIGALLGPRLLRW